MTRSGSPVNRWHPYGIEIIKHGRADYTLMDENGKEEGHYTNLAQAKRAADNLVHRITRRKAVELGIEPGPTVMTPSASMGGDAAQIAAAAHASDRSPAELMLEES